MKYKIYEGDKVLNCLKKLLKDGRVPATLKEVWGLRKKGKIPMQWYDTGTLYLEGDIRKATLKELKNIEEIYGKEGRLLLLYSNNDGLCGECLYVSGRFVGVRVLNDGKNEEIDKDAEKK